MLSHLFSPRLCCWGWSCIRVAIGARVSFPVVQGVGIDIDCQLAGPSMSATGRRAKAGACRLSAERDGPGTVGGNRDAVALLAAQLQPARPVPLGAADRKSTRLNSSH